MNQIASLVEINREPITSTRSSHSQHRLVERGSQMASPKTIQVISMVLLVSLAWITPSSAAIKSRTERATQLSVPFWSVAAVKNSQVTTNAPLVLSWSVSGGTAYDFFELRNTGNVLLNSFRFSVTQVRVKGSGNANPVFFESCTGGVWSATTLTCSGTIQLIGSSNDLIMNFSSLSFAPSNQISMRARTSNSNRDNYETSLSVLVSRTDVRPGQISHS